MSGQLNALAILISQNWFLLSFRQEAAWAPKLILNSLVKREVLFPSRYRSLVSSTCFVTCAKNYRGGVLCTILVYEKFCL